MGGKSDGFAIALPDQSPGAPGSGHLCITLHHASHHLAYRLGDGVVAAIGNYTGGQSVNRSSVPCTAVNVNVTKTLDDK